MAMGIKSSDLFLDDFNHSIQVIARERPLTSISKRRHFSPDCSGFKLSRSHIFLLKCSITSSEVTTLTGGRQKKKVGSEMGYEKSQDLKILGQ